MKINGYRLREALKMWDLRKNAAELEFPDSLHKFASEDTKESPLSVAGKLSAAEASVAKLQVAQMRYNLLVTVEVSGVGSMTLADAIKLSATADRIEKLWKSAPGASRRSYHEARKLERDSTLERAIPTMTSKEILAETTNAARISGKFRAALATGNAVEMDVQDLSPDLFE